ncbi:MAG: TRAP transporter fused permease subunit, partial [Gemmatimonadota bacterium]|nr:TRAP transporter fused permease subunit [Gemmatimonadota bacterium]
MRAKSPLLVWIAAAAAAFHLFSAGVSPFTALVQRPVHFALMALLGFLGLGVGMGSSGVSDGRRRATVALSWLFAALSVATCLYMVLENQDLVARSGSPTPLDLVAGVVAILLVVELARRTTGWGLVVVVALAMVYALAGPYLPGVLAHRGYGPRRLVEHLYLSTEGIWGIPLGVSADFVYLFILFGALLEIAGGGALLIGLAERVAGKSRGGPAKTAVVASALMGSLSGSAVANVVTTGAFTIPLMKKAGFRPYFAGAIEAAASTGGQLMPPVMGAGAFILATWTNIPYARVAVAASIPAALYYVALIAAIHFRACRMGLEPRPMEDREPVGPRLHLLIPLIVIVILLAQGRSPMRAAFWGVMSAAVLTALRRETREAGSRVGDIVLRAGSGAVQVAAACAAAGIVVGIASLTGIGLRMSELIITVSQGNLLGALVLTGIGSIILGMGLPTTAAYVVLAALGAPALTELGVPLLSAHLFIFYFGCISNVTPPVSLAAFAAAGVAGAPPIKTALSAMVLALAGFIVPFLFVYGPALLMQGSIGDILLTSGSAVLGVTFLAAAMMGYARVPLDVWERVLLGAGAFGLIVPGLTTDFIGAIIIVFVFFRPRRAAVAATVLLLGLTACTGGEGGPRRFLSIATAGTGGIYYPLGGAIARELSIADSSRQYTAEVTGGSVENVNRAINGEIDLAMAISVSPYLAVQNGQPGAERLRLIAPLYVNMTHVIVPADSPAESIEDFRGLRVSVGAAGS